MGKDSLLKSTSKKKPAADQTQEVRKIKTAKTKAIPQNLLLKKFDTWKPKKIFRVEQDKSHLLSYSAPPFVSGNNEQETKRIRELLFKKFDLTLKSMKTEKPISAQTMKTVVRETPHFSKSDDSKPFTQKLDPALKLMTFLIIALVIIFILIIAASSANRSKFYIRSANGAVEIWQGTFAPLGKERITVLPGFQLSEPLKDVYTKNEIYAFVFSYYLDKADTLLEVPGMPDFEGIKTYLDKAVLYAISNEHKAAAVSRLNSIDLMTYLYKADVAASKGTLSGFEDALNYLNKAAALKLDASQTDLLNKKILAIKELKADFKSKQATSEKKPPEASPK